MELQKRNGQRTNRGRVSVISMIQKTKTKQKQISKIEETNILIENLKTQNKNKSNLNPFNKKNKNKNNLSYPNLKNGKKKYRSRFRRWRMYGLTVSFCVLAVSAV